jgi:hypothetical protein
MLQTVLDFQKGFKIDGYGSGRVGGTVTNQSEQLLHLRPGKPAPQQHEQSDPLFHAQQGVRHWQALRSTWSREQQQQQRRRQQQQECLNKHSCCENSRSVCSLFL